MKPNRLIVLGLVLSAITTSCSTSGDEPTRAPERPRADAGTAVFAGARPATSCAVTFANGDAPPVREPGEQFHGNGRMWVALWPYGVIIGRRDFVRPDGSIGMKIPWWANGTQGELRISGRRLDQPAEPLGVLAINAGWPRKDEHGTRFWASGLIFPTEGCWEVTGRVGADELTFVTIVVKPF